MANSILRTSSALAGLMLALAATPSAWAQTAETKAGARAAAEQGLEAYEQGRYAEAIDLFTRANSLVDAPTHLIYVARAHEKLGQLVRAREYYLQITRTTLPSKAPPAFRRSVADGTKELAALEPRIPYVSVVVQGAGARDVKVTMDAVRVPDALVGVPRPVDPGKHEFQAVANGMESGVSTVVIQEGSRETVLLTLRIKPGASASDSHGRPPNAAPGTDTPDGTKTSDSVSGLRLGSYVAFGVGLVGLGLGTAFLVKKNNKNDEADSLFQSCNARTCTEDERAEIQSVDDQADQASTLSLIGFVVGGAGIATGVTLLVIDLSADSNQETAHEASVQPWVGFGSVGLSGRF